MRKRIKEVCDYVTRGATPTYVENGSHKVMNQATFSKGWIDESNIRYTSNPSVGAHISKGDLLMASTGGGVLGKVLYFDSVDDSFYADSHVSILRNKKGNNLMKFLYYWFSIRYDEINATMVKGSTNQTELQRNYLLQYELEVPSLEEQNRIVSYLDTKTTAIDKQVSLLSEKRNAYLRLKKSIINRAVTKGLNPDVKMKDSGVEWIGEIPEGWNVLRGKDVISILNGYPADSAKFDIGGDGIPLIRIRDISNNTTEVTYTGEYPSEYIIHSGDLLVGMDGDFNTSLWKGEEALLNQRVCKLTGNGINQSYLTWLIDIPLLEINAKKVLTTVKHLSSVDIECMFIPIPPLQEQQTIAAYLDDKCTKINSIVKNIDTQIEKYKLLKRALINEVVTGKRAV